MKGEKQKTKKLLRVAVLVCLLSTMSLSIIKATAFLDNYGFNLDFSTGDPYGYSLPLDKWNDEDAEASSDPSSDYDFTATVLSNVYSGYQDHDNVRLYPGDDVKISVPWYNSSSSNAVLRGESNYDVLYHVSGWWASDPSHTDSE